MELSLGRRTLDLACRTAVMAIVNRTPDSFFDRGRTLALGAAVEHALAQVEAGADIIDVGGVKAGPGNDVSTEDELGRVLPFVEELRRHSTALISVDTYRAEVARAVLAAGADLVNDVSGLRDPALAEAVAAARGAGLVVMHAGGPVRTRPFRPTYLPDVTTVVCDELVALCDRAQALGVPRAAIVVDPGHDFGKNTFHSLELTRELPRIAALGYPLLVALSRKDFLGEALGGLPPGELLEASLAAAAVAVQLGARIVRVHDTSATVRAIRTAEAILGWRSPQSPARGLD